MGIPTPQYSAEVTGRLVVYQGNMLVQVDATTGRGTLGLGTAALEDIGTSGANVPFLSNVNLWSGRQDFQANNTGNSGMATATDFLGECSVIGNGTGAAMMAFHRPGAYAVYLGIDTDNQLKVGGWSYGANSYKIWHDADATKSFAAAGYQRLPSGLIFQWGTVPGGVGDTAHAFPIAFPTACLGVVASTEYIASGTTLVSESVASITTTGFSLYKRYFAGSVGMHTEPVRWLACGY